MGRNKINDICYEMYCEPSIFWENVGSDKAEVLARAKECTTYSSLRKIVSEYI